MIGRIRTVKPEIFSDEKLWDLSLETGLPLLQAFQGLWCYADREGRFEWRPRALKTLILPYWGGDFALALQALEAGRYIVRYVVDGREYGYVRNFAKHQRVNVREQGSDLPAPPVTDSCPTKPPPVTDLHVHARGEGKGRELEGKGVGTEPASARDAHASGDSPPAVPGLEIVHPGPLQPSKREQAREAAAASLMAPPGLRYQFNPDWNPSPEHRERGRELGLTREEILIRAEDCRRKPIKQGFTSEDDHFFRELAWAKADKEKHVFKTKADRDAFEMPGRERRAP